MNLDAPPPPPAAGPPPQPGFGMALPSVPPPQWRGPGPADDRDEVAYLLALLTLPQMGPVRLAALRELFAPREAWEALTTWPAGAARLPGGAALRGRPERLYSLWSRAAARIDPHACLNAHVRLGVQVLHPAHLRFPLAIREHPDPPALLFALGDLAALEGPCVAIVGTRRATRQGLAIAREWGAALAAGGVRVISGLARGIDAAAHAGALSERNGAPPVGVVGSGLDVVYPSCNRELWHAVGQRGLLLGEAPLGSPPEPWRFPARNRLMASLAHVIVVVESHASGGALITAELADVRGRTVLAVPGALGSPASAGTNRLLRDGIGAATAVEDVLACLALDAPPARPAQAAGARRQPSPEEAVLLEAMGSCPTTLEDLVRGSGWPPVRVCTALDVLLRDGFVHQHGAVLTRIGEC